MAEVELRTAPADFRFPTTNQTRHCFTRYIEFHRCLAVKGEEASECDKFAKYYWSLCPGEWLPNATVLFPLVVVLVAILVLCMPLNVEIDAKGQSEFMDGDNEKDYDHHHHNNGNIYPAVGTCEKQLKVHAEKKYRDEDRCTNGPLFW